MLQCPMTNDAVAVAVAVRLQTDAMAEQEPRQPLREREPVPSVSRAHHGEPALHPLREPEPEPELEP